jgi:hypothetical protein
VSVFKISSQILVFGTLRYHMCLCLMKNTSQFIPL